MITLSRSSHPNHPKLSNQSCVLSPSSPQMWMLGVNKGVDNCVLDVRFAVSVHLSPPVDEMWTISSHTPHETHHRCGEIAPAWGHVQPRRRSSPTTHTSPACPHTGHPQPTSVISGEPSRVVHMIHTAYDDDYLSSPLNPPHNLRTTARGYLPYPSSGAAPACEERKLSKGVMS